MAVNAPVSKGMTCLKKENSGTIKTQERHVRKI